MHKVLDSGRDSVVLWPTCYLRCVLFVIIIIAIIIAMIVVVMIVESVYFYFVAVASSFSACALFSHLILAMTFHSPL